MPNSSDAFWPAEGRTNRCRSSHHGRRSRSFVEETPAYKAGYIASPLRTIELKAIARSARGSELPLETPQLEAALNDPDFYLFVVDNVRHGDPGQFKLRILGRERLQRLLRVKEQRYYALPWPVAGYDSCPLGLPD
jgi:hypothetical protein